MKKIGYIAFIPVAAMLIGGCSGGEGQTAFTLYAVSDSAPESVNNNGATEQPTTEQPIAEQPAAETTSAAASVSTTKDSSVTAQKKAAEDVRMVPVYAYPDGTEGNGYQNMFDGDSQTCWLLDHDSSASIIWGMSEAVVVNDLYIEMPVIPDALTVSLWGGNLDWVKLWSDNLHVVDQWNPILSAEISEKDGIDDNGRIIYKLSVPDSIPLSAFDCYELQFYAQWGFYSTIQVNEIWVD